MVTLCNLLLGCGAVVFAFQGNLSVSFWLIAAAGVCDFCDGLVARATGQFSKIGAQLDSLADVVSFGVAPAVVMFTFYQSSGSWFSLPDWLGYAVFLVAGFSALRLARFNAEDDPGGDFRGLPTPAGGLWVSSFAVSVPVGRELILVVVAIVCWLLISNISMFSLKFHGKWREDWPRYVLIAMAVFLIAIEGFVRGIFVAISLYIVSSLNIFERIKNER